MCLISGSIIENSLNEIKTLKTLELIDMINWNSSNINKIIAELPSKLEKLSIQTKYKLTESGILKLLHRTLKLTILKIDSPGFFINEDVYYEMLSIIKKRPHPIKLNVLIHHQSAVRHVILPPEIIQKNIVWLQIDEYYNKIDLPHQRFFYKDIAHSLKNN